MKKDWKSGSAFSLRTNTRKKKFHANHVRFDFITQFTSINISDIFDQSEFGMNNTHRPRLYVRISRSDKNENLILPQLPETHTNYVQTENKHVFTYYPIPDDHWLALARSLLHSISPVFSDFPFAIRNSEYKMNGYWNRAQRTHV